MTAETLTGVITCPECGTESGERIPVNSCLYFYECPDCGALLRPEPGDCCVFCSYGDRPCPSAGECGPEG